MRVALAVSAAAYLTCGAVAWKLWPLLEPSRPREVDVQLLASASATALGVQPPELVAMDATRAAKAAVPAPLPAPAVIEERLAAPPHADQRRAAAPLVAGTPPAVHAPLFADTPPVVHAPLAGTPDAPLLAPAVSDFANNPANGATERPSIATVSAGASLARAANTEETLPFGPGMTPPRRLSGEAPKYTPQALAARVEGKVIVRCVLTATGDVRSCRIVKPLAELDRAAVHALEASRFTPVTFQGRPTAVTYLFSFDFRLP